MHFARDNGSYREQNRTPRPLNLLPIEPVPIAPGTAVLPVFVPRGSPHLAAHPSAGARVLALPKLIGFAVFSGSGVILSTTVMRAFSAAGGRWAATPSRGRACVSRASGHRRYDVWTTCGPLTGWTRPRRRTIRARSRRRTHPGPSSVGSSDSPTSRAKTLIPARGSSFGDHVTIVQNQTILGGIGAGSAASSSSISDDRAPGRHRCAGRRRRSTSRSRPPIRRAGALDDLPQYPPHTRSQQRLAAGADSPERPHPESRGGHAAVPAPHGWRRDDSFHGTIVQSGPPQSGRRLHMEMSTTTPSFPLSFRKPGLRGKRGSPHRTPFPSRCAARTRRIRRPPLTLPTSPTLLPPQSRKSTRVGSWWTELNPVTRVRALVRVVSVEGSPPDVDHSEPWAARTSPRWSSATRHGRRPAGTQRAIASRPRRSDPGRAN